MTVLSDDATVTANGRRRRSSAAAKPIAPLLWELGPSDEPTAPIASPDLVAEMEAAEEIRVEVETAPEIPRPSPLGVAPAGTADGWLGGDAGRTEIDGQAALFETDPAWKEHWRGMPDFAQRDLSPAQSIYVHFRNDSDRLAFAALVGQTVTGQTRSIWYPAAEIGRMIDKRYVDAALPPVEDEDGPLAV